MKPFGVQLSELRKSFKAGEPVDWAGARESLAESADKDLEKSKLYYFLKKIFERSKGDKTAWILDYGCGGGGLLTQLYFLGHRNLRGVDISDQEFNREFAEKLGMNPEMFMTYDGKRLPYEDESFDIIASETVLEHVRDIEAYYSEASRVLKPGGMAFCYFPHRLVPFDTHSRTWFIHYFPAALRRPLYRRFATQEPEHYEGYLNFKTKGYHVRTALKYFSRHEDKTAERLRNFKYAGEYAGNNFLRAFADKLMRLPLAGGLALSLVSALADADLHFYK